MLRFHRLELDQQVQQPQTTVPLQRQEEDHDEQYWMQLADGSRRNGYFEESLRYYSRALETERSLVAGWVGQVQMLIHLDEYPEAELWSRKALEIFKSNAELMAGRAQALCRSGDMKQAQPLCDAAMNQPGQSAYPWMVRGELMLVRRDKVEEYCFEKAVQMDGDWLVALEIALIYLHYSLPAKALTRARQAVEKAPGRAYCWYRQGLCEAELGLKSAAQRSLRRCIEIKPDHTEARQRFTELDAGSWWLRRTLRRFFGRS
jgi:tetratricopeptide (TPR) repeat protein